MKNARVELGMNLVVVDGLKAKRRELTGDGVGSFCNSLDGPLADSKKARPGLSNALAEIGFLRLVILTTNSLYSKTAAKCNCAFSQFFF